MPFLTMNRPCLGPPKALLQIALGGLLFFSTPPLVGEVATSLDDCLAAYSRTPNDWSTVECFYQTARSFNRESSARRIVSDLIHRDPANYKLGLIQIYLEPDSRGEKKLSLYKRALTGFRQTNDLEGQIRTLDSLWGFYRRTDAHTEAKRTVSQLQDLLEHSENPDHYVRVAIIEARHAFEIERDFSKALDLLTEQKDLLANARKYRLRQRFLHMMGRCHFELGFPIAAYDYFRREAELARATREHRDEAVALSNLVVALRDRLDDFSDPKDRDLAIEEIQKILTRGYELQFADPVVAAHTALGDLLRNEESPGHYQECINLGQRSPELLTEYRTCRLRLAAYWARRDPERGLSMLAQTLDEVPAADEPLQATYDILSEIRIPWNAGDYEKAWAFSTEALDAIENLRELQGRIEGRARSFSAWTATYTWLFGRLLQSQAQEGSPKALERALEVSERMRARMLLDILETREIDLPVSEEVESKRAELGETLARKSKLQRDLRIGLITQPEQGAVAREEIEELVESERHLREQLSELTGRLLPLERAEFATLPEIQANLRPHEAFLVFQLAPDESPFEEFAGGSWVLVISQGLTRAHQLQPSRDIRQRLSMLAGLVEKGDHGSNLLIRAYKDLLDPALRALPSRVTDLIVIPDKILHRVPLAALRPDQTSPPVGARFRLTRVPSATLWLQEWRSSHIEKAASIPALVLADPDLGTDLGTHGPTGGSRNGIPATAVLPFDAPLGPALLDPLPFARHEGLSLLRHLGPEAEVLTGSAATERALKDRSLNQFGILHFAAHALTDEKNPDRSGVVLAPDRDGWVEAATGPEDGILHFHEIVDLGFADRAVVLSTCHSARGQILRGEGVFDLARAFFEGGARAVVGSLWRLEDRATARFFDDFYRHLARGASLSEALHLTQKDQIARGAPPSAWAGIVVIGDGSLIPFPDPAGRHHPGWVAVLALVLLAAAVGIATRRPG